jgi:two-component system phosphate regulon response regulator PhoB
VRHGDDLSLAFEPRDWAKLDALVEASQASLDQLVGAADDDEEEPPPTEASPEPERTTMPSVDPSTGSRPSTMPVSSLVRRFGEGVAARVLLVDDDAEVCDVVGAMLEAVGFSIESVPTGERALERIAKGDIDMVVLDWTLPTMSGIELCRAVRRDPTYGAIPVIFLTANASSRDVVDAFASGADDYVVKPFRAPELGARIFGLLRRSRQSQGQLQPAPPPDAATEESPRGSS